MVKINLPSSGPLREGLKKEILLFLQQHGGDAKARTVTLKHFMSERSLPPLFIKKAMGRVGLENIPQSQDKAKVVAEEKVKLQRRVSKMLSSFDVLNEEAILQVYSTLRKDGHKRRFIRTALFSIASNMRKKYGPEASKQLVALINPQKKDKEVKQNGALKSNSQNKNAGKKESPQELKGKGKNVSFSGVSEEDSDKSGKKIPPTPMFDRSHNKLKLHSSGKKVKSPAISSNTPVGGLVTELSVIPKSNESSSRSNNLMNTSVSSSSSSKVHVTPSPGGKVIEAKKSLDNLNGSFIQSDEKRKSKCNSNEESNEDAEMVDVKMESEHLEIPAATQDEQSCDSPMAQVSILKAGKVSSSTKKTAGKRVSFGSIKSPQVKTPVTSRQSINLIDLATPKGTQGILEEECPKLVPINDASTAKKGKKSPKFSPRVTRSAAKKKLSMA